MRIFAVTYTYNDAAFLNVLLGEMARWSVRPAVVLVVDDGSTPEYVFPAAVSAALRGVDPRLLRLPANQGPVEAKRAGMEAAIASGAEVILSLDADIRPHRAWLAQALPYLADPGVGLVGARFSPDLGQDALARYLRAFFSPLPCDEAVPYLGAGLWLLRRDTWLKLGGFAGFEGSSHEDVFFCRKLGAAGLRILAVNSKPVRETRALHRRAHLRRELAYLGGGIRKIAAKEGLAAALRPLTGQAATRLIRIIEQGDPAFLYLEIFKFAGLLAWLRKSALVADRESAVAAGELLKEVLESLWGYTNILAFLMQDLAALGFKPERDDAAQPPARASEAAFPLHFLGTEVPFTLLLKLESEGIGALNREDRETLFDTHYLSEMH